MKHIAIGALVFSLVFGITNVSASIDQTDPTITVTGPSVVTLEAGDTYTDLGATAFDDVDLDITASIVTTGSVNTLVPGFYTINYTVSDAASNSNSAHREITVVDTTKPSLSLFGSNPTYISAGDTYVDQGATSSDIVDGNLNSSIVVTGLPIDTSTVAAAQTITYSVTDSHGNVADTITRTVYVIDQSMPIITLLGTNEVNAEFGIPYTDAGATASDNIDGDISSNIVVTGLPIDTNVLGTSTIRYNVTDNAENVAPEVTRTVHVVDTTAPIITLTGSSTINLTVGDSYTDAGATASDFFDGNLTSSIVTVNPVSTTTAGTYTVTYNVTDSNGNVALQVARTVVVAAVVVAPTPTPTPVSSGGGGFIGGGGGGYVPYPTPTPTPTGAVLGVSTSTVATSTAQNTMVVVDTCSPYLSSYIKYGAKNNVTQVKLLQQFLNKQQDAKLPLTGFYGPLSKAAVIKFQKSQSILQTGYVYTATKARINALTCPVI